MFIITARGDSGFEPGEQREAELSRPLFKNALWIHWHHRHHLVHVENDEFGGTSLAQSIAAARTQVAQLVGGKAMQQYLIIQQHCWAVIRRRLL